MTDRVVVNASKTALLPPNSPQKGYRITLDEAAQLGLLDSADKPIQERRSQAPAPEDRSPVAPQKRRYTKRK